VVTSVGQLLVECAFAEDPSGVWQCTFHVFERLIAPLIMGVAFLDETETLTKHKYRLQEQTPSIPSPLKVNSLGFPKRRILCYMDTKKIYANADTGSELELMSRAYARRRGYGVQLIPKGHSDQVQFADGSTTKLIGQVEADITFGSLKGDKYKQTFYVICLLLLQPLSFSSMMPRSQLRGLADHAAAPRGTSCVLPLSIHQTSHHTPP
jgi:hypothetical protein